MLVALSLAVPSAAQTYRSDRRSNVTIDNFGRVNNNYYRGAQPQGQDYADLAALGVKTVIDLTSDDRDADEQRLVESAGMKSYRIPMTTHEAPTSAEIAEFMTIVNDPANQPVYVHCVGGRHRTGVMTAVYRMIQDGWNPDQAFKEMKQYKYGADFLHPEFKKFVYAYSTQVDRSPKAVPLEAAVTTRVTN
jgi:protein tyrosine/serine phosphatase